MVVGTADGTGAAAAAVLAGLAEAEAEVVAGREVGGGAVGVGGDVATAGAGTVVEEVEEAEDVDVLVARRRGARGLAAAAALMKRRGP
jgi:hypothetical protein